MNWKYIFTHHLYDANTSGDLNQRKELDRFIYNLIVL